MGQHSEDVVRPFLEEPNKRMRGRDKGLFQVVMYVKKTLFYNESSQRLEEKAWDPEGRV